MTKIEEIFKKHNVDIQTNYPPLPSIIELMMKEYAELYARKVLEIAAENVETYEESVSMARDSILNIKLPEHE